MRSAGRKTPPLAEVFEYDDTRSSKGAGDVKRNDVVMDEK